MESPENGTIVFRAFHKPSFPRPDSVAANFQAAIFILASTQSCSNCIGLTYFSVECMRVLLYQSSHAMVTSLAARMVSNRSPCSRSTFSEPNSDSEQALSQQLPLRLIEGVIVQYSSTSAKPSLAY